MLAAVSCQHEEIWDKLNDHEQRIEQLEKLCKELNSNVMALQTALTAIQTNDYVTDVMKVVENGVEVGYSLTFAKAGTVILYHGKDGAEADAPKIGVKKAADGAYYWTAGDEWLTADDGSRIPATVASDGDYVTPLFRVADGVWYVSFDNGNSWRKMENTCDDTTAQFFQNVTYDNKYVHLTLADGSVFKIPYSSESRVVDLFIFMGQSNMSGRGVASEAPQVPEGWGYEYKAISDPGKLLHMVEPFGLNEDNATSGVDDSNGTNGTKRKGSSVSALTIAYYQHTDVPVVGVSCSKGGTSTTFWLPGTKPLNDAIARQLAAEQWLADNGYTVRNNYMFWLQGENDMSMSPDTYRSNMISIVKEMINKTGVTNCMMLRVGQQNTATAAKKNNIIEVQTELCQTYTEFVMASTLTAGFVDDGLLKDTWHYTQEGYNILGTDAGKNVAFYANNGIEPNMYDPYYKGLYYPINKYKSIFDDVVVPDGYTTVGTAQTLVKIVDSFSDLKFVDGYTFGGGSDRNFKQMAGRATSVTEIVRVSGGETLVLSQPISGVTLTYGLTEYTDKPCVAENLTSAGQKAVDWLTDNIKLQDDTNYIIVSFKKTTTEAFTASELELLKQALKIRPEIPVGVEVPEDGVLNEELFVRLEATWITNASTKINIGKNPGYNMCYLPVDISDYSSISITAQADYNVYFQFFKDDYLSEVCGNRIIVDMGKAAVYEIPEGAKYFVVSHSRTNLTDVAGGYGNYFPAAIRLFNTTAVAGTGPWAGKKMVVMGDSLTAGAYREDSPIWYQALAAGIGITDAYGSGVSGSAISTTSFYGTNYQPMVLRYENLPSDGDLYIIFGGTNDYTLSSPLGTIEDVTDVSFYGALDVMIKGLKAKVPNASIVFLTPFNRYGYGQTRVGKINLITPYTLNDEGHNLYDYRKAILDKCEQYSVPVIDVFSFPELNFSQGQDGVSTFKANAVYAHPWTRDGLHLNSLGEPAFGKLLVPYFNEIGVNAGFPSGNEDLNNSTGEW